MTEYFDRDELRDPAEREATLFSALPAHIARARQLSPGWAEWLADVNDATITSREALAQQIGRASCRERV